MSSALASSCIAVCIRALKHVFVGANDTVVLVPVYTLLTHVPMHVFVCLHSGVHLPLFSTPYMSRYACAVTPTFP